MSKKLEHPPLRLVFASQANNTYGTTDLNEDGVGRVGDLAGKLKEIGFSGETTHVVMAPGVVPRNTARLLADHLGVAALSDKPVLHPDETLRDPYNAKEVEGMRHVRADAYDRFLHRLPKESRDVVVVTPPSTFVGLTLHFASLTKPYYIPRPGGAVMYEIDSAGWRNIGGLQRTADNVGLIYHLREIRALQR